MLKTLLIFLKKPFKEHLSMFLSFFLLISFFDLYACLWEGRLFALCVLSRGFMDSYFFTLIYTILGKKLKTFYVVLIYFILTIFFLIDLFIVVHFKTVFAEHIASIILGTNLSEAKEFFSDFITWETIIIFCLSLVTFIILYHFSRRPSVMGKHLSNLSIISLLFCFIFNVAVPAPFFSTTLTKISIFLKISKTPNLKDFYTHPKLVTIDSQPQNIVLIIGESFSKKHSSLYGYEKCTNPYLERLKQDSSLLIFNHIRSAYTGTADSFRGMMTTFRFTEPSQKEWYKHTTLPEIIKEASYRSSWISNQSYTGSFDNVVSRFADLCDTMCFVGEKFTTSCDRGPDELVLNPLAKVKRDSLNFFIVHLMGSHFSFRSRYPEEFHKFKETDYLKYPAHQRYNRATYDNSVLYNDSVVYEAIKLFQEEEAIVFYFPDHSIDIYESSEDYCSHANMKNKISREAGYNIPFMVYFTPKYKEKFPHKVSLLKANIDKKYSTEDILYTMMDIMGVKFLANEDMESFSLLRIK